MNVRQAVSSCKRGLREDLRRDLADTPDERSRVALALRARYSAEALDRFAADDRTAQLDVDLTHARVRAVLEASENDGDEEAPDTLRALRILARD